MYKAMQVFGCVVICASSLLAQIPLAVSVKGYVYLDVNKNRKKDSREPGIANVVVSNGKDVVTTNASGAYQLPAYEEMIVFISKPSGYLTPLNKNNIPQFFYIHQPNGSPAQITQFEGLNPTGPLPHQVNFPLYFDNSASGEFSAIIAGDNQVYSEKEIEYFRDSFVKEISDSKASFVLCMGDNVGDMLSLYPRYLSVLSKAGLPVWLVPGNHDMNFDAPDPAHSLETFKSVFGPPYYSFNYGDVHFIVLNSVQYPSSKFNGKTYHGEIDPQQMEWLSNDLYHVPYDKRIVLNMHIPLVSDIDRLNPKHQVDNREAVYALLEGRKVVSLGGHTHTLAHFMPGEMYDGWGQPTPIPQIIVGAVCGSWWSGDLDPDGVPMSYQRCGAPRGYMKWNFSGTEYTDRFKACSKSQSSQMHLSFQSPSFDTWYNKLWAWTVADPFTRPAEPPVTINDLPDQSRLSFNELHNTTLVINVWNGSIDSKVIALFDGRKKVIAKRSLKSNDPYALRHQSYVFRYALGFALFNGVQFGPSAPQPEDADLHANSKNFDLYHVWTCPIPSDLEPGVHTIKVMTQDSKENKYNNTMIFEIVK